MFIFLSATTLSSMEGGDLELPGGGENGSSECWESKEEGEDPSSGW